MKCIRCGHETLMGSKICSSCLDNWEDRRGLIFDTLVEKIWRTFTRKIINYLLKKSNDWKLFVKKDKEKFILELKKIIKK